MTPEIAAHLAELNAAGAFMFEWIAPTVLLVFTGFVIGWVHDRWLRISVTWAFLSTVAFIHFCGRVHRMLAREYAGTPPDPDTMVAAMELMVLTTRMAVASLAAALAVVTWQVQIRAKRMADMVPATKGGTDA